MLRKSLFVLVLLVAGNVQAQVTCTDVAYGAPNYHENMARLARAAGLKGGDYNRHHESAVSDICEGKGRELARSIDNGFVTQSDASALKRILTNPPKGRSEQGKSYGYSRQKFADMGLCNACADSVALHYTKRPDSTCGKLAKQSLEGNPEAIRELRSFPSHCEWKR